MLTFTVAALPSVGIAVAASEAPSASVTDIGIDVLVGAAAKCTVTVAAIPFAITALLIPARMHIVKPGLALHWTAFPAAEATGPTPTSIEDTLNEE